MGRSSHRWCNAGAGEYRSPCGKAGAATTTAPDANVVRRRAGCRRFPRHGLFKNKVQGRQKRWRYYGIRRLRYFLADSNGKCSILILGSTYQVAFSYRQIGTEARVAFVEANGIRLMKFTVANGSVGSLPLSPSIVYTPSWTPGGVNDVELSADGQTIYSRKKSRRSMAGG